MSHYYKDGNILSLHEHLFRDIDCDIGGIRELLDDIKSFNESIVSGASYTDAQTAQLRLHFATAAASLTTVLGILEKKTDEY